MPNQLLEEVERLRIGSCESRSDLFRRAVKALLRQDEERRAIERYVQGYTEKPEDEAETAWASLGESRIGKKDWQ
ncbi:MAG TPA: ribbon-helix-helix protein, CopG family [Chthonomonadales bacterium]|nr:ribbon-helix-helix protein, CopG family [Chthonomonadales bacterium]